MNICSESLDIWSIVVKNACILNFQNYEIRFLNLGNMEKCQQC